VSGSHCAQNARLSRAGQVRRDPLQELPRTTGTEWSQVEHADRGAIERIGHVVARGRERHDRVVLQAPGEEAEDFDRCAVQLVHILGDHQERLLGGAGRRREPDAGPAHGPAP